MVASLAAWVFTVEIVVVVVVVVVLIDIVTLVQ